MNEHFDRHESRMTDRERAAVWSRIREGKSSSTRFWRNWKLWSPVATGAIATVVLAIVLIDKTPNFSPEVAERAGKQRSTFDRDASTQAYEDDRSTQETPSDVSGQLSRTEEKAPGTLGEAPDPEAMLDAARRPDESAASPAHRDVAESSPAPGDAAGSSVPLITTQNDRTGETSVEGDYLAPPTPAREGYDSAPSAQQAEQNETGSVTPSDPWRKLSRNEQPATESRSDGAQSQDENQRWGEMKSLGNTGSAQETSPSSDKPAATLSEVEIGAERERIKSKQTDASNHIDSKDLESLPVNKIEKGIGRKLGVIANGGDIHFRGGRAGEIGATADGAPTSSAPPSATEELGYSTGGSATPNDAPYDAMFFRHYGANPLVLADMDSFSTFATDVDQGAYTIMRRYVEGGNLPDRDSPRVEEFVNYFDGGYPEFYNPDFRILVDGAPSPFGDGFYLVRVGVKGRVIDASERKPAHLVFVVDVSGSMAAENRLGLVRQSLHVLLNQLRSDDRVGIVAYGSNAFVVLESTTVENRRIIEEAIESLQSNGSTNAEEGLLLGYEMARRYFDPGASNRILLCSDGVANVGRTGPDSILERVASESDKGIDLSTIGFGMGNYNDVLMERLADQGDGVYYYVDDLEEARRVFVENLSGTLQTIARDAKIQVAFEPSVVLAYRLLGFENRDVADKDFRNDAVDAGEIGAGHEVTALYEVRLQKGVDLKKGRRFATAYMRYALPDVKIPRPSGVSMDRDRSSNNPSEWGKQDPPLVQEIQQELTLDRIESSIDRTSPRFRLAAVVAEYAEILRQSYWAKGRTIDEILPMTREVARLLQDDSEVTEFLRLVEKAQYLEETMSPDERADRERFAEGQPPAPPYFPPVIGR